MKKFRLLGVLVLLAPGLCWAAPWQELKDLDKAVTEATSTLSTGDYEAGLRQLFKNTVLGEEPLENVLGQIKEQRPMLDSAGKYLGFEVVSQEAIGDSLFVYKLIEKYQQHVVAWRFDFYKNDEGWQLLSLSWRDDLSFILD